MDIEELEQKYNDLEMRVSKVESCLRGANKKRLLLHKAIEKSKMETLSQASLREEQGDRSCSR